MLLIRSVALPAVVLALLAQARNPSPRELLEVARPLTSIELATVLGASQQALTAKTLRLSSVRGGQGVEVLMGPGGQPKIIRITSSVEGGTVSGIRPGSVSGVTRTQWREDVITIVDYTGRPALLCDGSLGQGELVIEYTRRSVAPGWTVAARQRGAREAGGPGLTPVFEMLQGAGPVTSGERRQIGGGRWARAFLSPWTPLADRHVTPAFLAGDPTPNVVGDPRPQEATHAATQRLWIDTASLLPVRWEVSERGALTHHLDFAYESIDLRPGSRGASVHWCQCVGTRVKNLGAGSGQSCRRDSGLGNERGVRSRRGNVRYRVAGDFRGRPPLRPFLRAAALLRRLAALPRSAPAPTRRTRGAAFFNQSTRATRTAASGGVVSGCASR